VGLVFAEHFLQEHDVCPHGAHRVAQFRQHKAAVKRGEAFMGVDREYF